MPLRCHPIGTCTDWRDKSLVGCQIQMVFPAPVFLRCAHDISIKYQKILLRFKFEEHVAQEIIVSFHLLNPPCSVGTSSAAKP